MPRYYLASIKGKRESNEDQEVVIDNINHKNKSLAPITYLAVFDGHAGPKVSKYLADNLKKYFLSSTYPMDKKKIRDIYDIVQKKLEVKHGDYSKYSGSTALVGIMYKHKDSLYLRAINTGDCRMVICRNNIASPLTKDHKPNKPEEFHRINALGGKIEYDGYDYRINSLSVSRAFGDLDARPEVTHVPDVFKYHIEVNSETGDKFMVLACDGLWDVMDNQEVIDFILLNCYETPTSRKRINKSDNIANKLAKYAIDNKGSTDNVSVIVYFF